MTCAAVLIGACLGGARIICGGDGDDGTFGDLGTHVCDPCRTNAPWLSESATALANLMRDFELAPPLDRENPACLAMPGFTQFASAEEGDDRFLFLDFDDFYGRLILLV